MTDSGFATDIVRAELNAHAAKLDSQLRTLLDELLSRAVKPFYPPRTLVIGCSTSEVSGGSIGHFSAPELGELIANAAIGTCARNGILLAAQCCEHLNRALVVERETAEQLQLQPVWAVPQAKAGGSFATAVWALMREPVLVEGISAEAGLDIGDTLIGMHLKRVAVPVRLSSRMLGHANITAALCRPPLIGGIRAKYE